VLPLRPQAPAPSADPIDDVLRTLIAECSGSKAGWRTDRVTAAICGGIAIGVVKDALIRLGARTQRALDGNFVYWIDGERDELFARAGLAKPALVVAYWRALVGAEKSENARLKARIAQLEELLGELKAKTAPSKSAH
jgi:hypothetical protein